MQFVLMLVTTFFLPFIAKLKSIILIKSKKIDMMKALKMRTKMEMMKTMKDLMWKITLWEGTCKACFIIPLNLLMWFINVTIEIQ